MGDGKGVGEGGKGVGEGGKPCTAVGELPGGEEVACVYMYVGGGGGGECVYVMWWYHVDLM